MFLMCSLSYFVLHYHIDVEGAGRGAISKEDLEVGDTALEIPISLIISEEVMNNSDMVCFSLKKLFPSCVPVFNCKLPHI